MGDISQTFTCTKDRERGRRGGRTLVELVLKSLGRERTRKTKTKKGLLPIIVQMSP